MQAGHQGSSWDGDQALLPAVPFLVMSPGKTLRPVHGSQKVLEGQSERNQQPREKQSAWAMLGAHTKLSQEAGWASPLCVALSLF
jgi:hypothetical protein